MDMMLDEGARKRRQREAPDTYIYLDHWGMSQRKPLQGLEAPFSCHSLSPQLGSPTSVPKGGGTTLLSETILHG